MPERSAKTALRRAALTWVALAFAGQVGAATISGTVFEDRNYGGGAGRSLTTSGGQVLSGVRVELYRQSTGTFVDSDTTDALGHYSLDSGNNANGATVHVVRVVNGTVRSARTAGCTTCVGVQTYRTDVSAGGPPQPVTNRVGGETPALSDAASNTSSSNFSTLNTAAQAAQSVTPVDPPASNSVIDNVDFGFNFDTVVNTRDPASCTASGTNSTFYPCQGSLRQFIINANALGSEGALTQSGSGQLDGLATTLPSGFESSIFMIPSAALTIGVATITLSGALPTDHGCEHAARCDDADGQHRQHQQRPARYRRLGRRRQRLVAVLPAAGSATQLRRERDCADAERQLAGDHRLRAAPGLHPVVGIDRHRAQQPHRHDGGGLERRRFAGGLRHRLLGARRDDSQQLRDGQQLGDPQRRRQHGLDDHAQRSGAAIRGTYQYVRRHPADQRRQQHADRREPGARSARRRHRARLRRGDRRVHERAGDEQHRAEQRFRLGLDALDREARHGRLQLHRQQRRVRAQRSAEQRRPGPGAAERERHDRESEQLRLQRRRDRRERAGDRPRSEHSRPQRARHAERRDAERRQRCRHGSERPAELSGHHLGDHRQRRAVGHRVRAARQRHRAVRGAVARRSQRLRRGTHLSDDA